MLVSFADQNQDLLHSLSNSELELCFFLFACFFELIGVTNVELNRTLELFDNCGWFVNRRMIDSIVSRLIGVHVQLSDRSQFRFLEHFLGDLRH
ncbi:hypothetical protein D3C85_1666330 [compost metagenome]